MRVITTITSTETEFDMFDAMLEFAKQKGTEISCWTYIGEEAEDNAGNEFDFPYLPFNLTGLDCDYFVRQQENGFDIFVR